MNNTWYYTLSTIPQVLSGILGLIGIFTVLALEGFKKDIRDYRERAIDILKRENYQDYNKKPCNIIPIKTILEDIIKCNSLLPQKRHNSIISDKQFYSVKSTCDDLNHFINKKYDLIKRIKFPAIFTSFTIMTSISFLSLSNIIINNLFFWLLCVIAVVVFTLFSFILIINFCWETLTNDKL